jgi:DEAD/DEAH box helicase domain-containing protein
MLPLTVAHQLRGTLLDYLRTTFGFKDAQLEQALFAHLTHPTHGLFKGPFVDVRLPFREATGEQIPLDVAPRFTPYAHQLRAFQRLSSRDGHTPEATLVTTGTGSGKTECFLYPILDHCLRHAGEPGIKAIILYPMNALATDQAERIAKELAARPELQRVTAGLYVGGEGKHGVRGARHLVDDRKVLRQSPPDILLTNYRMLDLLLMRPADQALWHRNDALALKYLVLDELHTYDGAQGSDVACLIRRLKARLGTPAGHLGCVGTSATIGSGDLTRSKQLLVEFAQEVFGEPMTLDAVVGEDRKDLDEVFPPLEADGPEGSAITRDPLDTHGPDGAALAPTLIDPAAFSDPDAYLRAQASSWLDLHVPDGEALDPVEVGLRLTRHVFLRRVLMAIRGRDGLGGPRDWAQVVEHLAAADQRLADQPANVRWQLLSSFLGLVAFARTRSHGQLRPFLTVQVQLWVRELRGLVRRLQPSGHTFAWRDELDAPPNEHYLPLVYCRECGADGLGALVVEGSPKLKGDSRSVGEAYLRKAEEARFVQLNEQREDDNQLRLPERVCPSCLRVAMGEDQCSCQPGGVLMVPAAVYGDQNDKHRFRALCPKCGADDALRILGSRAASLSSVAVSHLFHSPFHGSGGAAGTGDERKLLAFTDSVQDASHRAGFFAGRTYRFNLRTAMQSTLVQAGGELPLSDLAPRMLEHWSERLGEARMVATFMPPDLREHADYVGYLDAAEGRGTVSAKKRNAVMKVLRERLSWEVTREYGYGVTVGRTLEGTVCSTLTVDDQRMEAATRGLTAYLEEHRLLQRPGGPLEEPEVRHFLEGLVRRLRMRGGVFHPLLSAYAKTGNRFLLSKRKNPHFSPFGPQSVAPRFLYDGVQHNVFDTLQAPTNRKTWWRDWTSRSLKCKPQDAGIGLVLEQAFERLAMEGVVRAVPSGKSRAFGLEPAALRVTSRVQQAHCTVCNSTATLPAAGAAIWEHGPCNHYQCRKGYYQASPSGPDAGADADRDYYRALYRSGRVYRIFTGEHTGLLERPVREALEIAFKTGNRADAPNLLTCTPTLEMGIDIGDLEAVMLCSVPPLASNYLQRVGRAGRSSGNALVMTIANARPHDLYFHASPDEMLRGEVRPPGCFLDAAEMLKRQLAAHAMDRWARDSQGHASIPRTMSMLLGKANEHGFPRSFQVFYEPNQAALTHEFLQLFEGTVSEPTREALLAFAAEGGVVSRMLAAFERIQLEQKDLRKRIRELDTRRLELDADPSVAIPEPGRDAHVNDAAEFERGVIDDALRAYKRVLVGLGNKGPMQVLCDESVLPNYAFPEPGVTLKSVLRGSHEAPVEHSSAAAQGKDDAGDAKGRGASLRFEYMRPAQQALREFAPFNTFYAEGHKVKINQIDLGSKEYPLVHAWRFCPRCHYGVQLPHDHDELTACPRCSAAGWSDSGQRREVVRFQQAWSSMRLAEATTVDESDDREEESYELLTLVDVPEDRQKRGPAWLVNNDALLFGYELLRGVDVRQLNMGRTSDTGHAMEIAGQSVAQQGFVVCRTCGKVQDPRAGNGPQHTPYCRAKLGKVPEEMSAIYLGRSLNSEALRVLLPVTSVELTKSLATFEAALQLGLRKHFGGQPAHLRLVSATEPAHNEELQFIVIYDSVPGGTGYLADLAKPENFRAVVEKAHAAMRDCECAEGQQQKDGCYKCVLAYQHSRNIANISRRDGLARFGQILAQWDELAACSTLSEVDASSAVESELEMKFFEALRGRVQRDGGQWETTFHRGRECYELVVKQHRWRVVPQVEMQAGPVRTRPDFGVYLLGRDDVRPMAVYCDGLRFHVQPEREVSRLGDDVHKRRALTRSEVARVWSVTWKDVAEFSGPKGKTDLVPLFSSVLSELQRLHTPLQLDTKARALTQLTPMEQVYAFLENPDEALWREGALHALTSTLTVSESPAPAALEVLWKAQREDAAAEPPAWPQRADAPLLLAGRVLRARVRVLSQLHARALQQNALGKMKALLRLDDHHAARQQEDFELEWRTFLQAWNLLQFFDGADVVSAEFVAHHDGAGSESELSKRAESEPPVVPRTLDGASVTEGQDLLSEFPEAAELVARLARADLPMPEEVTFRDARGGIVVNTALAWEDLRIGLVEDMSATDLADAQRHGVRVFDLGALDQHLDEVISAVRTACEGTAS